MRVTFYCLIFLFTCCFSNISSAQEKTKSILATGTAFSITNDGFLLTSAHILSEKDKIEVMVPGGNLLMPAKLIALDRTADLALLKITSDTFPLPIIDWANVSSGLEVVALGFPSPQVLGESLKITSGIINSIDSNKLTPFLFQFSAEIHPGNSGGPVLSLSGDVVGIAHGHLSNTRSNQPSKNVNYAVKSSRIIDFLRKEKIDFLRGVSTINSLPQEIFSKYEKSIYLVKASGSKDFFQEKLISSISTDIGAKSIESDELPEKLRFLLKTLPEREKPKIFGAYKAGYNLILESPESFLIIKSDSIQVDPSFDSIVVEFDSIVSYKSERLISGAHTYNSILMHAVFKCESVELNIRRQEFKSDVFGVGKTLTARRIQSDSTLRWSEVKPLNTQNFLLKNLCDRQ
jgi:hypothetical protein